LQNGRPIITLLVGFLLLNSLNLLTTFSQETPPPTAEPSPSPTETATELLSFTPTFTDLPPPTATNTELPSLTPTETATATTVATETPLETATETVTVTATVTPTATPTETASATTTLTPGAPEAASLSDRIPTPGTPDYAAVVKESQASGNQAQLLGGTCSTSFSTALSVVAAPPVGNAGDLYTAIGWAHGSSVSPYPIYLCPGEIPLSQTAVLFVDINFYGQGMDVSTIYQAEQDVDDMAGMFTLNGNTVEFHDLTVKDGQARSQTYGATVGGAVKVYSGTLNIYNSKFKNNRAYDGGAIAWGDDTTIENSIFVNNVADTSGGALLVDDVTINCTRFFTNSAIADVAGAIGIGGGGVITNSAFIANIAGSDGGHIYNFDTGTVTVAESNWWGGSSPSVPGEISSGVDADPAASHDPTGDQECVTLEDLGITWEGNWTSGELQEILIGAIETARALYAHGAQGDSPVEAFRNIMQGWTGTAFRQIHFIRDSLDGTYCITTPNPTADFSATIECDDDVDMTQYTTVHEFGHVFVGRTNGDFRDLVGAPAGPGVALFTPSSLFVIGPRTILIDVGELSDWQRSDHVLDNGWGSAAQWDEVTYYEYNAPTVPPPTPTQFPIRIPAIGPCGDGAPSNLPPLAGTPFPFQQNPCTFSDEYAQSPEGLVTEIEEAAADMFLNWVYWKNYPAANPTGFLDVRWRYESYFTSGYCYPTGCPDDDESGQTRQTWMESTMTDLFTTFGW